MSDPARNQAVFLALNHAAALLPDFLWSALTVLGDTLVALCLLLFFLRRRPDLALAVLLASLPATLLSHGLKEALDVARPYALLGDQVHVIGRHLTAGSFPSGHATTIFVLAAVLSVGLRSATATPWILLALPGGLLPHRRGRALAARRAGRRAVRLGLRLAGLVLGCRAGWTGGVPASGSPCGSC